MRIFILTLGTRGDLEPFWALGRQLGARGHAVTIGTSGFHIKPDPAIRWVQIGDSAFEEFAGFLRLLGELPDLEARSIQFGRGWAMPQVSWSAATFAEVAAAHDYFISNMKFPLSVGNEIFPGAYVSYDPPAGLAAAKAGGSHLHRGRTLDLVAMNKALVDPSSLWDSYFHFTGFWEPPACDRPRGGLLEEFLREGDPPVVLTMGSMVMFDAAALAETFLAALELSGRRGVIVSGWSHIPVGVHRSGRIVTVAEADYGWLFGQSCCVVHHGGVGTLAAVLRAGVPSVLLPQVGSQQRWGSILEREYLSAGCLRSEGLEPKALAAALATVFDDARLRYAALAWKDRLRADPGLPRAVELIEAHWIWLQSLGVEPKT